jgi:NAD(P)-dependent dehydrogenase (short-subunit alcohol dehydrogenase family)
VIVLDRDIEAAGALADSIGGTCEALALDVTSEADVARVMAEIAGRHGRIDILVANAASTSAAPPWNAAWRTGTPSSPST